ncbi:MAG: hypothetical protein ACSNEK_03325 [Parachlamydiaceae bacterium]
MRWTIFILISFFCKLSSLEFSETCHASIEVLPLQEDLVDADVYIRPFKDVDVEYPRYLFKFNQFPIDDELLVSIQRIAQNPKDDWKPIYKFSIKSNGMLMNQGKPIGFLLCLSAKGFIPGERVAFRFDACSGFRQEVSFVPYPLVLKSRMGALLIKAELLSTDPTRYRLEFPGLKLNEIVTISAKCFDHTQGPFKHNGSEEFIFCPDIDSFAGGISLLTVGRRTTQKFKLELPWGTALLKQYGTPKIFHPCP